MDQAPPGTIGHTLQVTVRYDGTPVSSRTVGTGSSILPDVPVEMSVQAKGRGFVVSSKEGQIELREGEEASLSRDSLSVEVGVIRKLRFPRFQLDQGDWVLPTLVLTMMLGMLQLQLLLSLFMAQPDGGPAAPEPSPEFIARLLNGQHAGSETGKLADQTSRPGGDKIENYYLPSGHMGPTDKIKGGKNVGNQAQDGPLTRKSEATAPPLAEQGTQLIPSEAAPAQDQAEELEDEEGEKDADQIAKQMTRGWGFNDWYDTEDARKEAAEIKRAIDNSKELLRIDPNDAYALSVLAYYQYLAMDYKAARATYEKFTQLYPDDPAGWNNLALTYKRAGDYQKEEQLYRQALALGPMDDHAMNNLAVCLAHQGRYEEALDIMRQLEAIIPDDPYADLHRAKIYAAMGKEEKSYNYLQKSLSAMRKLDTLHNIEFRQDIRVDPAFDKMREQERFSKLLTRYYGDQPGGWWRRR